MLEVRVRAHRRRNLWQAAFELRGELGVAHRASCQLQVGVALVAEHEGERLARRAAVRELLPVPRRVERRERARRRRGGATRGHGLGFWPWFLPCSGDLHIYLSLAHGSHVLPEGSYCRCL